MRAEVVVKCHLHNQGHKDGGGGKHGHWEFVNACWYIPVDQAFLRLMASSCLLIFSSDDLLSAN